jgi:hypothetical protein
VGNFGDGRINAFDPKTGQFLGQLSDAAGNPITNVGIWGMTFGNGAGGTRTNTLYFAAGLNQDNDGLFASIQVDTTVSKHAPILPNLPGTTVQTFSTVPANGDQGPHGVAFVPQGIAGGGTLQAGDLLVSNFNNAGATGGTPGTGSTIQLITPTGQHSTFFSGIPGQQLGLDGALGVLRSGFVIAGNLPTAADGTPQQGSLLILDDNGNVVANLTDARLLNGPSGLAINDQGGFAQVFVSNVNSGTVTRIDLIIPRGGTPHVLDETQIASGFAHANNKEGVAVGPGGLAFDARTDTLFVASTADNTIFAIPHAAITFRDRGTGEAIIQNDPHLHGPLGLVLAPNGDLIVANGDAVSPGGTVNDLVEFDPFGDFVGDFPLDKGNPGAASGLALATINGELRFAAVNDNTNTVTSWSFQERSHTEELDAVFAELASRARHKGSDDPFGLK